DLNIPYDIFHHSPKFPLNKLEVKEVLGTKFLFFLLQALDLFHKVEYAPKNKILSTNTGFKALINGSIINGNTLNYDVEKKILQV
ncbi:hypothetical protein VWM73_12455, partial [Campylobacter coli]